MPRMVPAGLNEHSGLDLTVVVPAFNEESRLPATLEGLAQFLDSWGIDYHILVVDDGSHDNTAQISRTFGSRFSTLCMERQSGKGAAVKAGMLAACSRIVAFTDADLPYDLVSLRAAFDSIASGACEVVFGARDMAGSAYRAKRSIGRSAATALFREIVRTLVSRQVTDTQCGLKVFSQRAAQEIFSRVTIQGFAFDAEVVYLTHLLKLPFQRVPVTLVNEYGSTLSLSRHAFPMLVDVVKLRVRAARGEYAVVDGRHPRVAAPHLARTGVPSTPADTRR